MNFLKSGVMLCLLIYSDFILILRCWEKRGVTIGIRAGWSV